MSQSELYRTAKAWDLEFEDVRSLWWWVTEKIPPHYRAYQFAKLLKRKYDKKHPQRSLFGGTKSVSTNG